MPPKGRRLEGADEFYLGNEAFIDGMAKWLDNERPTLKESQIQNICQRVIPRVGQQITASLKWSNGDINVVNQSADEASDTQLQHEDTVLDQGAETGQKLYKLCLRMWHVFPTEIICPGTGLVFGSNTDDNIQSKLIEMKWTRSFNDALSKFVCICNSDDRRPWKPEAHGDPFFEAFLHCQEEHPDAPKKDLLDVVEQRLKGQRQLPSRIFSIFQSIASTLTKSSREDIDDDYDEGLRNRAALEPWHLLTVRTRHLTRLVEALDNTHMRGVPTFCPSAAQLSLVTSARDGGKYHAKDAPTKKSAYKRLRKVALKGLRASAIAYKLAWDKEKTVIQDIPRYLRPVPDTDNDDDDDKDMETPPRRRRGGSAARGRSTSSSRGSRRSGGRQQGSTSNRRKQPRRDTDEDEELEERPLVRRSKTPPKRRRQASRSRSPEQAGREIIDLGSPRELVPEPTSGQEAAQLSQPSEPSQEIEEYNDLSIYAVDFSP
ncbi:hypothetical protein F4801DRAFT_597644 [Xylaria longipes]|nr:hypothetical protein F4801DRAFT_597644 [Xylaria longipes]